MKQVRSYYPDKIGLYDSANEHDACGVGFVAHIKNKPSHKIIEQGIMVLERMEHRGALGGDNKTGDGAGVMMQIPDEFFQRVTKENGVNLPEKGKYGVGMVFLPLEKKLQKKCIDIVNKQIKKEGLNLITWRDVPVNSETLGRLAADTAPVIQQVFIDSTKDLDTNTLERKLYLLRKMIERELRKYEKEIGEMFYICSMSARTIIYKGLLLAPQIPQFYPELNEKDFKSAIAIVHARYSTNTFPMWHLAHPFRAIAHNGEINTLRGNVNQMRAREKSMKSDLFGKDLKKLFPVIKEGLSDSASLDNAVEFFMANGRSLPHTMMMLVPQAFGDKYFLDEDLKGFLEYHAGLMEPWDGPAGVAFSNGKEIGAVLDRNGLRPARYTITKDDIIVLASEAGVMDIPANEAVKKGRLSPGQMIHIDLEKGHISFDHEIKTLMSHLQPYRRWVKENKITLNGLFDSIVPHEFDKSTLLAKQTLFGYSRDEVKMVITPMIENGMEPTGSMGNDAALAVLSEQPQLLYGYFKQLFAQVTNPAIDPIRERLVMSLSVYIGKHRNILTETPQHAELVKLETPVLTNGDLDRLRNAELATLKAKTFTIGFKAGGNGEDLQKAIDQLKKDTEKAVKDGISIIVLSDKNLPEGKSPMPSLLATSAIHHHLVVCGTRTQTGIIVETGEAREIMHFALLLGYGATAVNPYLAFCTIIDLVEKGDIEGGIDTVKAMQNYIKSVNKGLLKIMSKMGISTLRSYRGSQIFEAIGLAEELVDRFFTGTASRIQGIGLGVVAEEANVRLQNMLNLTKPGALDILNSNGQYHFRKKGEKHLWHPDVIVNLQLAAKNNDKEAYAKFADYVNSQAKHLCTLRGLFKFKTVKPISIDEVEPATEIMKRFVTGAMSLGSLSKNVHETIAIAMNRIQGMSNSGEGGEDPIRFKLEKNGDSKCSAIKQVASGRFGVTIEYLANSKEIQIKIAQGAKPGEGGQLPGKKVDKYIARVRNSTPGVTLISPPPHHDIYSIEDLAQLIYDLKNANPAARVSVKLVSEIGVGTVAAGVSKGHADMVLISGHDGGTGASPMTSIKHAGLPWELGLAETQQTLVLNHLRDRIRVQVDGGLKTGRDIVIGGLLGGEEFGFGTAILVVCGCVMMRKCHSNTCPVGVATQDPDLCKRFKGKPEDIINYLTMLAEEARSYMAQLGIKKFDDLIGRSDLLKMDDAIDFWKTKKLDFSKIFEKPSDISLPVRKLVEQDHGIDKVKDVELLKLAKNAIDKQEKVSFKQTIRNTDRTTGTIMSSTIAKKYGNAGLPEDTINIDFSGVAGQSFGAFLAHGVTFKLTGESNDYVGKGISGGKIIIVPPDDAAYDSTKNIIAGNVLMYGATSGEVYIRGRVGERFCIRNSGVKTVVEGIGDHGCEYMTGGISVILGPTGVNFAAGMSGGFAYVYDEDELFNSHCNLEMVDLESVIDDNDICELRTLLENHVKYTGSEKAKLVLDNWEEELPKFVKVFPIEYKRVLGEMMKEDAEIKRQEEEQTN